MWAPDHDSLRLKFSSLLLMVMAPVGQKAEQRRQPMQRVLSSVRASSSVNVGVDLVGALPDADLAADAFGIGAVDDELVE